MLAIATIGIIVLFYGLMRLGHAISAPRTTTIFFEIFLILGWLAVMAMAIRQFINLTHRIHKAS
jgi:hypothetical protein